MLYISLLQERNIWKGVDWLLCRAAILEFWSRYYYCEAGSHCEAGKIGGL